MNYESRGRKWFGPFLFQQPPDMIQDEHEVVWIKESDTSVWGGYYERLEDVIAESYDSAGASREHSARRRGSAGDGMSDRYAWDRSNLNQGFDGTRDDPDPVESWCDHYQETYFRTTYFRGQGFKPGF